MRVRIPDSIVLSLDEISPISSFHGKKEISDIISSYSPMIGRPLPPGRYETSDAPQGLAEYLACHPVRAIRTSKGMITPFWESEDSFLHLLADLGVAEHRNIILFETKDHENLPFARSHKNAVLSTHWYQSRPDPFNTPINGKGGMSIAEWEFGQYGKIRSNKDAKKYLHKLEQSVGALAHEAKRNGVPSYLATRKILPMKPENHHIIFPLLMAYSKKK